MFGFSRILFVFFCFFLLSGCAPSPRLAQKGVPSTMLYMEQWDVLARYISDEVLHGLGERRTVCVAGSGITSFKKGLRELLVTALARKGLRIVDSESGHPVLEFDILPVSGTRKGLARIMLNTSILDNGQYIYRSSTIHAVPNEDLHQYIEDDAPQAVPFKSYQLVAN